MAAKWMEAMTAHCVPPKHPLPAASGNTSRASPCRPRGQALRLQGARAELAREEIGGVMEHVMPALFAVLGEMSGSGDDGGV